MGTRSLTVLPAEGGEEAAVLYRQMDGYPEGHGLELAGVLLRLGPEVNGLSLAEGPPTFNGPSCLAASLVAHFKTEPGGFYLYPAGTRDTGEEYVYTVLTHGPGTVPTVRVENTYGDGIIFEGDASELAAYAVSSPVLGEV